MEQKNPTLDDVLNDLQCRWVINVPEHDMETTDYLMFDIERAYYQYEDEFRAYFPSLPKMSFQEFLEVFFSYCPLLKQYEWKIAHRSWTAFKKLVPWKGAILLNPKLTKVLMVKGYGPMPWTFPGGKINEGEDEVACAIREVHEETGIQLNRSDVNPLEFINIVKNKKNYKLFLVPGISESTYLNSMTKGEIEKYSWVVLDRFNKSNRFHLLPDILDKILVWIKKQNRKRVSEPTIDTIQMKDIRISLRPWNKFYFDTDRVMQKMPI